MEINKKLGFKVVAVLTSASMILGGLAGCGKEASEEVAVVAQSAEADENDDLLSNVMNQVAHRSTTTGTEPRKDEVVYVMADAQGNTQKIIVSDCLKNANGESTITDASSLTDIKNVKGNESYTVDADGNLVWNADGSDIYYQGTTDKELPVDVSISYELEGKEIAPEDLVGKTGNVTIRFTYTNNEKTTVEVNGKEKEVYVPFAMISGAILPAEHFSDIEVTNGKVISEGDNNIVVGMAFPGLKDSVNIDSLKEKAVDEEAKEKLGLPFFIKPCNAGSSYGIHCVESPAHFAEDLADAFYHDGKGKVILEKAIKGFEIGCAVMGNEELIAGSVDEIEISGSFFDYEGKYEMKDAAIYCPARIDETLFKAAQDMAKRAYRAMNCSGMTRVDMFVTSQRTIIFNELNTIPGFTATSRYPSMMKEIGVPFTRLIDTLVDLALQRKTGGDRRAEQ